VPVILFLQPLVPCLDFYCCSIHACTGFLSRCCVSARKVLFFFWAGSQVRSVFFVVLKSGVCLAVLLDLIFSHLCVLVSHQSSFRSVFSSMGILVFNACGSFGFLSTVSI
jgi:hypothetical protein